MPVIANAGSPLKHGREQAKRARQRLKAELALARRVQAAKDATAATKLREYLDLDAPCQ